MMEFLKEWTYTICITLVISVVFSILTPKGNMGRFFKIILAAFIFLSFIYPIKSSDIDLSFPEFNISDIEDTQSAAYKNTIDTQINQTLEEGGYSSCVIKSDIDFKNDEIYVNGVTVSIPSIFDKDDVKSYLFDSLGIIAEVYYIGE